ncbi:MAG: BlaI/MecI/CopY family transcriptional regulator [Tannerellaceae bacterium]|jgi:predicted transcriptional regulator|nr:BlaI/MecI/CopY family transcriptional regulator [Tannerellaceae bacterium]
MEVLTQQEEAVMLAIWRIEPCYIRDILARYPDPKPPYTTLASIVKNLERKEYVKSRPHGNTYQYVSLVTEGEYKRKFINNVVRNYFANSYKEMVSFFTEEQKISAADLEDIIRMIEEGKNKES